MSNFRVRIQWYIIVDHKLCKNLKAVKLPKGLIHLLKFFSAKVVLNFHLNVISYWGEKRGRGVQANSGEIFAYSLFLLLKIS